MTMLKFIIICMLIVGPGVTYAKTNDEQNQIILLNDSAAALEDTDPVLSKRLAEFADAKQKAWEKRGGNQAKTPASDAQYDIKQLQEQLDLLNKTSPLIQTQYPLIAKGLDQMAADISKTIGSKKK